ncbi:MAG: ArsR/SmtB family transcription factor [Christensenellaceae bacterium]
MDAKSVIKAVSDDNRLEILSLLMNGDKCVEEIAGQLNISVSTASFHLKKLTAVGLLASKKEQYYRVYHLNRELLDFSLSDFIGFCFKEKSDTQSDGRRDYYEAEADEYYSSGTLKKLPTKVNVRRAVLKKIANDLKRKTYTKRQLYLELSYITDDFKKVADLLISQGYLVAKGDKYGVDKAD